MSRDRVDKHAEQPHERGGCEKSLSEKLSHNQKANTPEMLAHASVYLDNLKLLSDSDSTRSVADRDNDYVVTKSEIEQYKAADGQGNTEKRFLLDNFASLAKTKADDNVGISDADMNKALVDNLAKAIASSLKAGDGSFGQAMQEAFENYAYTTMPNMLTFNVSEPVATKQFEDRLNKLLAGSPYKCQFTCETFETPYGSTGKHLVLSVRDGSKSLPNQLEAKFNTER